MGIFVNEQVVASRISKSGTLPSGLSRHLRLGEVASAFDVPNGDFATVIEPDEAMKIFRHCAILNRRSIAKIDMILSEQTSGEGCSANVPTRQSLGRFVLRSSISGSQPHSCAITAMSRI